MTLIRRLFAPSIRRRILASFLIVALLVMVITIATFFQLNQVRAFSEQVIPDSSQMGHLQNLALATSALDADLERFLVIRGVEYRDNVLQDLEKMSSALAGMRADADAAMQPVLQDLETINARLQTESNAMLDATTKDINQRTVAVYNDIEQTKQLQQNLSVETLNKLQATAVAQGRITSDVIVQVAILGSIVFLIALTAALLINRTLRPIGELTETATAIAGGDLSRTAPVKSRDEIGVLAQSFNTMTQRLRDLIGSLEQRINARTEQLRASADVGRAAVSILDTNQLLREIVNLISDRFGFYYTAVFLADGTNKWAVLREATGEAGRVLRERKHQLEIGGQSMVGTAMKTRTARIALDVGDEAVRFANPLLPNTRSEIALPLVVGTRVIGALDVQSTQVAAFDEASAAVLQSMADQIAIALSNTMQFQQAQASLQRTRQLYEASTAVANATDAEAVLQQLMTQAVSDASAAQILTYGPLDEAGAYAYLEVASSWAADDSIVRLPAGTRILPDQIPPIAALATEPYIVRDAADPTVPPDQQEIMQAMGMQALLGYALIAGSQPLGLLVIVYRDPRMFTPVETQPLQALAGQIAVTLRNQQLVREQTLARQQLDEINRRLTGQVWQQYARERGQAVRKIDVGPGVPQDTLPSELVTPVVIHGQEIGRLRLEDVTPDREWKPNEKALIEAVAGEVAIAIENARLIEQTERRAQREARLNRIAQHLRQTTDIHTILQTATEQLSLALDTSHAQARLSTVRHANGQSAQAEEDQS